MTKQDLNDLSNFLRYMAEKTATKGSCSSLVFSAAANECERYRGRHFPFVPTPEQIEAAKAYFKGSN